jgi:hypothetical protein
MALRGRSSTRRGYRPADRQAAPLPIKEEEPKAVKPAPKKKTGLFSRKKK